MDPSKFKSISISSPGYEDESESGEETTNDQLPTRTPPLASAPSTAQIHAEPQQAATNQPSNQPSIPSRNQVVQYKLDDSDSWEEGTVMNQQPKRSATYNMWVNISKSPNDELCVNWERVEEWRVKN